MGSSADTFSAVPQDILQSHILKSLDGQSLAAVSSVNRDFRSYCSDDTLWESICTSTWPSVAGENFSGLLSGHRSLYSDCATTSCPLLEIRKRGQQGSGSSTAEFISAVDVYCDGEILFSKIFSTETLSPLFLNSAFKIELLGPKETVATPLKFEREVEEEDPCKAEVAERLKISWILIDPSKKRAFNVAGVTAVEIERHWLTDFIHLRYATVVAGAGGELFQCSVVVICGGKLGGDMAVVEASLQVENVDGKPLTGMDGLVIIDEAMEGQRRMSSGEIERERYRYFLKKRTERSRARSEHRENMDLVHIVAGVALVVAVWALLMSWRSSS